MGSCANTAKAGRHGPGTQQLAVSTTGWTGARGRCWCWRAAERLRRCAGAPPTRTGSRRSARSTAVSTCATWSTIRPAHAPSVRPSRLLRVCTAVRMACALGLHKALHRGFLRQTLCVNGVRSRFRSRLLLDPTPRSDSAWKLAQQWAALRVPPARSVRVCRALRRRVADMHLPCFGEGRADAHAGGTSDRHTGLPGSGLRGCCLPGRRTPPAGRGWQGWPGPRATLADSVDASRDGVMPPMNPEELNALSGAQMRACDGHP